MNNFSFLAHLMIYALKNPTIGKQILQAKYHSWQDSKTSIFNYAQDKSLRDDIFKSIFPEDFHSKEDLRKVSDIMKNYTDIFFNKLKNETYPSIKKPYPLDYTLDNQSGLFLYILCKIIKPKIVVETGVAYGLSSMYILQALFENKMGALYSIDSVFSPWQSKEMIGSAIPSHLRENWKLIFGSSQEKLEDTLNSLNSIDIFFHDSLHTYKNMQFEFKTAWPFINKNGFLLSDDIIENNAFHDFSSTMNLKSYILSQHEKSFLGIIKKS